jgi:hypothetical protein
MLWSSLLRSLLQPPATSSLLGINLFSNTSIYVHFVCETKFHTYTKTTGKIIVFYILIFKFLWRGPEDERLNRMTANCFHPIY